MFEILSSFCFSLSFFLLFFLLLSSLFRLGKAFFDSQLVGCHLALPIYKHLLAMPITFHDLEVVDADLVSGKKKKEERRKKKKIFMFICTNLFEYSFDILQHSGLVQLMEMEDISQAYMDFTITEEVYGATRTIPLVEGGDDMDVTNDNVREYVQALVKYHMLNSIKDQLSEFLQGFYDVIPQPLLSIFDHREIELVLCGEFSSFQVFNLRSSREIHFSPFYFFFLLTFTSLTTFFDYFLLLLLLLLLVGLPNIDKPDWRKNTLYAGMYESKGDKHQVIQLRRQKTRTIVIQIRRIWQY